MAGATREQVWDALFTLLIKDATLAGIIQGFSRIFILRSALKDHPAYIDSGGRMPFLMIKEEDEETTQNGRSPSNREWRGWIVVYGENPDKRIPGATFVNPIIEAIENALNPTPGTIDMATGYQTLGRLVTRVWIEGQSVKHTGDDDPDGFYGCALPIRIRVP